jgi:hypothetical protein
LTAGWNHRLGSLMGEALREWLDTSLESVGETIESGEQSQLLFVADIGQPVHRIQGRLVTEGRDTRRRASHELIEHPQHRRYCPLQKRRWEDEHIVIELLLEPPGPGAAQRRGCVPQAAAVGSCYHSAHPIVHRRWSLKAAAM